MTANPYSFTEDLSILKTLASTIAKELTIIKRIDK